MENDDNRPMKRQINKSITSLFISNNWLINKLITSLTIINNWSINYQIDLKNK